MASDASTTDGGDGGFTLVEIVVAIVLVGILSAVVVVGVGTLTAQGSDAGCTASADAARAGAKVFWTTAARQPVTFTEMASSGALDLGSGVGLDDDGRVASGDGWTLVMVPGADGSAPSFTCTDGTPPEGFVVGPNGHFYSFVPLPSTWSDAVLAATTFTDGAGRVGYLATITSDAEHDAVAALVGDAYGVWAGATDAAVEGEWRWATGPEAGDPVTLERWAAGEPNNHLGDQDCLHLWQPFGHEWDDMRCDAPDNAGFLVEIGG